MPTTETASLRLPLSGVRIINATLIDLESCASLWPAEPRHHKACPRGLHIIVAQFGDGDGLPPIGFFALRVSPFGGRTDDLLSSLASLLNGIGTEDPDLDTP